MKESKRYFKDIKKLFPVHGKREIDFLDELKIQINEYEQDNQNCTYQQLSSEFGTPIDVMKSYYDTIDSPYILKRLKIKSIIVVTCVAIILCSFMLTLWKMHLYEVEHERFMQEIFYLEEDPIEVIEGKEIEE